MKTSIYTSLSYIVIVVLLSSTQLQAQSNTFPSSGNVGIGTSSPSYPLEITGVTNTLSIWKGNGHAPLRFYSSGDGTHNNASIDISSYGWGGSEDLRFKIGNWGGSYYFKYGSINGGEYNAVRITRSGGGSGGVNAGAGIIDVYTLNQAIGIRLHGNGSSWINTGNVGIGTSSPKNKLQIGNAFSFHDGGHEVIGMGWAHGGGGGDLNSNEYAAEIRLDPNAGNLRLGVSNSKSSAPTSIMTMNYQGNVGIGTTNPSEKLTVHGTDEYIAASHSSFPWGGTNVIGVKMGVSSAGVIDFRRWKGTATNYSNALITQVNSNGYGLDFRVDNVSTNTPASTSRLFLAASGNVGIGTTAPKSPIDVRIGEESGVVANFLSDASINDEVDHKWTIRTGRNYDYPNRTLDFGMISNSYGQNPSFYVAPKGEEVFRITELGNVGIGTTTPSQKLSVAGTINSEEIIVEENVGADFVFEASYDLPSLQDIEAFIEQNQHLPGIAPASQMIEEGVKVGELQMQLLQKIEELTLYVIEQQKLIEATLEQNQSLVQKNYQLEQRIQHLEQHEN